MGAIGGTFRIREGVSVLEFTVSINRSMSARAKGSAFAYIGNGISLISRGISRNVPADEVISIHDTDGMNALVLDGTAIFNDNPLNASELLSEYEANGELPSSIYGDYALALYDGAKNEILLLRDSVGSRPLFYATSNGLVSFASELKALLGCDEYSRTVRREAFCDYMLSGIPKRALVFEDIFEVPHSGGCRISKAGIFPFQYDPPTIEKPIDEHPIDTGFVFPLADELHTELLNILNAFDVPSFDVFMPSFLYCVDSLKQQGIEDVTLYDPTLTYDIRYSIDRRDRLCSVCGRYVRCVPPIRSLVNERDLRRAEGIMLDILSNTDKHIIRSVLGTSYESRLRDEKNTSKRIRTEGMLCQLPLWCEKYNPVFI